MLEPCMLPQDLLPKCLALGMVAQPTTWFQGERGRQKRCFLETFLYLKFKTILLHTANCAL